MTAVDRTRLPVPGPAPAARFPAVARHRLTSGLELRTARHPGPPVVHWLLLWRAGTAADPPALPGLAALTADLFDEGTEKRPGLELHAALDLIGARLGVTAGPDATLVSLTTLERHAAEGLALLREIVTQPRFAAGDFDRVRELRRSRIRELRTVPAAVAERVYLETLYRGHPYGHPGIGTDAALSNMTVDDVRRFHRERYRIGAATLIAAGPLSDDAFADMAERTLGGLPAPEADVRLDTPADRALGGLPASEADGRLTDLRDTPANRALGGLPAPEADGPEPDAPPAAVPPDPPARLVLVDRPGAVQSELRIGHVAAARRTPGYHALQVLNMVLGGQFVSRLNQSLREEKGYTYGVRTAFRFRRAPGPFVMQGSVQADATVEAVREVLDEMRGIGGGRPVTPDELALARSALTRGFARGFETAGQVAGGVAQIVQYDLPDDEHDRFVPAVAAVDAAAVTDAARRLQADRAVVVVVGPAAQLEPALGGLALGEPQRVDALQEPVSAGRMAG